MTTSRRSIPAPAPEPAADIDLFGDDPVSISTASAATLEVMESEEPAPASTPPVITITPTVVEPSTALATDSQLARLVKDAKLETDSEKLVLVTFSPLIARVQEWTSKIDTIIPKDREPTMSEHKVISETRKALVKVRTGADKERKRILGDAKRFTDAMNGANNQLVELVTPLEEKLQAAEQFAERKEEARKVALAATRHAEIAPFATDTSFYNFREMPDDVYTNLVVTLRTAHEAKVAAVAKAEADRVEKERADREERERVRIENERLRTEAAEREKAFADERAKVARDKAAADAKVEKERAQAEAKAKAERDKLAAESAKKLADERAKAKADADAAAAVAKKAKDAADALTVKALVEQRKLKEERDAILAQAEATRKAAEAEIAKVKAAEAKRIADIAAAQKRAAKAPDQVKLRAFAAQVSAVPTPTLTTPEGIALCAVIVSQMGKLGAWLGTEAEKL